jgi:hypothetical protein
MDCAIRQNGSISARVEKSLGKDEIILHSSIITRLWNNSAQRRGGARAPARSREERSIGTPP